MAASKTPSSRETISRFYKALSLDQPSEVLLTVLAQRVDGGVATYGEVLKTLYTSATVGQQSPADELVRMFMLSFDRAPDAPLFGAMMDALRAGSSLAEMAGFMLDSPGFALSNAGFPRTDAYVTSLLVRSFGWAPDSLVTELSALVDTGALSRAQLLTVAAGLPNVLVAPDDKVETALLYLAGAGREASIVELATSPLGTDARIISALAAGGLSATGGNLAFFRDGASAKLYGDLGSDLVWNAELGRYTLGGAASFKIFYSLDGGLSGSVVDFNRAMVEGVTSLDMSDTVGKGKLKFTANPLQSTTVHAPMGDSVLIGSQAGDWLMGSDGKDTLYAMGGRDVLTGGLGDDKFVLPASTVYQAGGGPVRITDFGVGKDVLDVTRLLGKAVDISSLKAVLATSSTGLATLNGGVTLVENNGAWVSGSGSALVARAATPADIVDLIGVGKLFQAPKQVSKSLIITADTRSSADVWLLLNSTDVTQITDGSTGPQEIFHVAHLEGSWNVTLVGTLPVPLGTVGLAE